MGPGEYYYRLENMVYNIRTGEKTERNKLEGSYKLNSISLETNRKESKTVNNSHINSEGFIVIKEDKYFRNLNNFPMNWFGECGMIALSILLGYLDTFKNDAFIPNDYFYAARYYIDNDSVNEEGTKIYDGVNFESQELLKKIEFPYIEDETYTLDKWPTEYGMPGTNFAIRDYFMDKYRHVMFGRWPNPDKQENGYAKTLYTPMADQELKGAMNDYIEENCHGLKKSIIIHSGDIFYTHQHPKDYIRIGMPTILVLINYEHSGTKSKGENKFHNVVAYGYKNEMFLAHMGWYPGSTWESEIVISSATIYAY